MPRSGMAATPTGCTRGGLALRVRWGQDRVQGRPYKTAVRFELKSVFEPGKDNPEIEAVRLKRKANGKPRSRASSEPNGRTGRAPRAGSSNSGAPPTDRKAWTCEAEAAP